GFASSTRRWRVAWSAVRKGSTWATVCVSASYTRIRSAASSISCGSRRVLRSMARVQHAPASCVHGGSREHRAALALRSQREGSRGALLRRAESDLEWRQQGAARRDPPGDYGRLGLAVRRQGEADPLDRGAEGHPLIEEPEHPAEELLPVRRSDRAADQ